MAKKRLAFTMLMALMLSVTPNNTSAQVVTYAYDACGNRTSRTIVLSSNKSAELDDDENNAQSLFDDMVADIPFRIYPNPTHGRMTVEIPNKNDERITIVVYDLNGSAVVTIAEATKVNVVDISGCKNGIYIMRITCGDKMQSWKILKN